MNWLKNIPIVLEIFMYTWMSFVTGILIGAGAMWICMTLAKETVSYVNMPKVLENRDQYIPELKKEKLYPEIDFESRVAACKSKIEERFRTKVLIVEVDLPELEDHGPNMHRCLVDSMKGDKGDRK